jgi:hypothetical protein
MQLGHSQPKETATVLNHDDLRRRTVSGASKRLPGRQQHALDGVPLPLSVALTKGDKDEQD